MKNICKAIWTLRRGILVCSLAGAIGLAGTCVSKADDAKKQPGGKSQKKEKKDRPSGFEQFLNAINKTGEALQAAKGAAERASEFMVAVSQLKGRIFELAEFETGEKVTLHQSPAPSSGQMSCYVGNSTTNVVDVALQVTNPEGESQIVTQQVAPGKAAFVGPQQITTEGTTKTLTYHISKVDIVKE